MDEQLKFFTENGYVVVHGALTPAEVATVNGGIDGEMAAHPKQWEPGPRPGHVAVGCDAPELLHRTEALDGVVPFKAGAYREGLLALGLLDAEGSGEAS